MNKVFINIINALFPARCIICNKIVDAHDYICERCKQQKLFCGGNVVSVSFASCKTLVYAFNYHVAKLGILKLKQNKYNYIAKAYAYYLSQSLNNNIDLSGIDVIVHSPAHIKECKNYKDNHAYILAKALSLQLNINLYPDVLIKTKITRKQHKLNQKQRSTNLTGAFEVINKYKIKDKTILFVDDVFTTGATVKVCSEVLMDAGAKKVIAACATKTNRISEE